MSDFLQVATTIDSAAAAERIARRLVENRLAACVQILGPVHSIYRWEGQVQSEQEWQCVVKTRAGLFGDVEAAIRQVHSYDVPEILATPVLAGSRAYLDWLLEGISTAAPTRPC